MIEIGVFHYYHCLLCSTFMLGHGATSEAFAAHVASHMVNADLMTEPRCDPYEGLHVASCDCSGDDF